MHLEHSLHVAVEPQRAWEVLTDLKRVASCMPGAELDAVVGEEYQGRVTAKVGPITAKYAGVARLVERDDVSHRAVIEARGKEEVGNGGVRATITAQLEPDGAGSRIAITSDIDISGRAAQFGRSILSEVSASLLGEFGRRLESLLNDDGRSPQSDTEALDVARTVVLPLARKAAVPAAMAIAGGLVGWFFGRRTAHRR